MAELTLFGYRAGHSLLHRLDVRFKLLFFSLLSLSGSFGHEAALSVLTIVAAGLMRNSRLSLPAVCRELRYFFLLLIFILVARSLTTTGDALLTIGDLHVTANGVADGLRVCWRILVVISLSLLFVMSTRTSEIRAALVWCLDPLPFIPARRIASMIGLIVRFVPVIFDRMREIEAAQLARGIGNRKNPLYRLGKFALPLMRNVFKDADKLITAMEARCYTENRTGPILSATAIDWIALAGVVGGCGLTLFL